MDAAYLLERITKTKATIALYEDAIDALIVPGVQKYSLDTGQDKTDVTKFDLPKLQESLDILYNRLCTLQARYDGSNVLIASPTF